MFDSNNKKIDLREDTSVMTVKGTISDIAYTIVASNHTQTMQKLIFELLQKLLGHELVKNLSGAAHSQGSDALERTNKARRVSENR